MAFTITVYKVDANGDTKEVCWNEYNSEWLGKAYTNAWSRRLSADVISHVKHIQTGRSANFVAKA